MRSRTIFFVVLSFLIAGCAPSSSEKNNSNLTSPQVPQEAKTDCSIVPAGRQNGQDYSGSYSVKVQDKVITGNHSVYGTILSAAEDLQKLKDANICTKIENPCTIVPAGKQNDQDYTGSYNIKIGDWVVIGDHSVYDTMIAASEYIVKLRVAGICK